MSRFHFRFKHQLTISSNWALMTIRSAHISFAVGSQYGPRSAKWIVSISANEVYVSTAKYRHRWHVSLHSSGRWHFKEHLPNRKQAPVIKLHRANVPAGQYPIGLLIYVPDDCLRPASDPDRTSVPDHWLTRPAYGGMLEIGVTHVDWKASRGSMPWLG